MPTRVDGAQLVYKYLTGVTALMTETTNRVYGPPLGIPPGITAPCKFLRFAGDGGAGNPDVPMASERYTFNCYGATQTEAQSVARVLIDALDRKGRTEVTVATGVKSLLRWAGIEMGPADLPEPDTGWPRVVLAFRVLYGERAVNW